MAGLYGSRQRLYHDANLLLHMKLRTVLIFLFALACQACGSFQEANNTEIIFPKTDVGTPTGPPISKTIGPEGGSISMPDGRISVDVPAGAVIGNTQFSIQPITNMAINGIGSGYRLEPGHITFPIPLKLTFHFDDRDLAGTVAEALLLAFQDKDGSWHAESKTKLNEQEKTLTVATTHFSDWLYLRTVGITPAEKKVLVGEAVPIKVDACPDRDSVLRYNPFNKFFKRDCYAASSDASTWVLKGAGTLTRISASTVVYTAPSIKPADNRARVIVDIDIMSRDPSTGEVRAYPKKFESWITIIDRGYKATGQDGTFKYSGVVCSLDKPFALMAANDFAGIPWILFPQVADTARSATAKTRVRFICLEAARTPSRVLKLKSRA